MGSQTAAGSPLRVRLVGEQLGRGRAFLGAVAVLVTPARGARACRGGRGRQAASLRGARRAPVETWTREAGEAEGALAAQLARFLIPDPSCHVRAQA